MSEVKYLDKYGAPTTPERAAYASVNGVASHPQARTFGGPGSGPHPGGGGAKELSNSLHEEIAHDLASSLAEEASANGSPSVSLDDVRSEMAHQDIHEDLQADYKENATEAEQDQAREDLAKNSEAVAARAMFLANQGLKNLESKRKG